MSGIAGIIDFRRSAQDREPLVSAMVRALRHRGPDAQSVETQGISTLGAAVLRTGKAPATPEPVRVIMPDGHPWLAAIDGCLHNREELRREFSRFGFDVDCATDATLGAFACARWAGEAAVHLEGGFSLAVWDGASETLWLIRDKFGCKPLYYADGEGGFSFGSEQKALLVQGRRAPGFAGLCEMFLHGSTFAAGHTLGDRSFFQGVLALRPGHALRWNTKGLRTWRYWSLADESFEPLLDRTGLLELQEDAFSQAVARMTDGVDGLGSMLSGGVDSSLATSEACTRHDGGVTSGCISFKADRSDPDPTAAALVSRWLNERQAGSHVLKFTDVPLPSLFDDLDTLVRCADEPQWDTRQIGMARNFKTLRDSGVSVALSGDLASQIAFGNFPRFPGWRAGPKDLKTPNDFREMWQCHTTFLHDLLAPAFHANAIAADLPAALMDEAIADHLAPWWHKPEDRNFAVGIWYIQTFGYSLIGNNDRLGLLHSVETRFPYASERMLKVALRTPFAWNTADDDIRCGKAVLRQLGRTRLPREIWHDRGGLPLPAPIEVRYHLAVADRLEQEIALASPAVWDIVDRAYVQGMVAQFRAHVLPILAVTPNAGESVTLFNPNLPVRTVHLFSVLGLLRWFDIYQA